MPSAAATYRFTVGEYHRMGESGIFAPDARVELIEGEIVERTPIGPRHAACVNRLTDRLAGILRPRAILAVQNPVILGSVSEPQPDIAVLRATDDYYASGHPRPDDILLLIEVADTSRVYDRETKLPIYARHGVPETWLIDLAAETVEVCRDPGPEGYGDVRVLGGSQEVRFSRGGAEAVLTVGEILGDPSE